MLGDSLSAGYGLKPAQGWVALLEKRLQAQGYEYRVVNASVSGETTGGGLATVAARAANCTSRRSSSWSSARMTGCAGCPSPLTRDNLDEDRRRSPEQPARKVLLVGMRLPPNYGPRYTSDFMRMYREIATTQQGRARAVSAAIRGAESGADAGGWPASQRAGAARSARNGLAAASSRC